MEWLKGNVAKAVGLVSGVVGVPFFVGLVVENKLNALSEVTNLLASWF
jgi:hypothetical protein